MSRKGSPGRRLLLLALAGLATVAAAAAPPPSGGSVDLDAAAQSRLGVRTSFLKSEKRKAQIDAFAKVLDPGPLAALQSDLLTAVAAAEASRAEARRSKALNAHGGFVSSKDAEAAEAQAKSDALKVAFLRQRLGLEWGPGVSRLSARDRAKLVSALASGEAALVHVDTPSNDGQAGARTVKIDVGSDSVDGVVLGPARSAEPRLQSSGLIVKVTGRDAILLSIGLTQSAHIDSGDPRIGVLVPRSAIIRYRGSTWAYVRRADRIFDRRLLTGTAPEEEGLFVTGGVSPSDPVVTEGAIAVFAAELARPVGPAK